MGAKRREMCGNTAVLEVLSNTYLMSLIFRKMQEVAKMGRAAPYDFVRFAQVCKTWREATEDADLWHSLTVAARADGEHLYTFLRRREKGIRDLALCVPTYSFESAACAHTVQGADVLDMVHRVGLLLQHHCCNLQSLALNGQYARILRPVAKRIWPSRLTSLELLNPCSEAVADNADVLFSSAFQSLISLRIEYTSLDPVSLHIPTSASHLTSLQMLHLRATEVTYGLGIRLPSLQHLHLQAVLFQMDERIAWPLGIPGTPALTTVFITIPKGCGQPAVDSLLRSLGSCQGLLQLEIFVWAWDNPTLQLDMTHYFSMSPLEVLKLTWVSDVPRNYFSYDDILPNVREVHLTAIPNPETETGDLNVYLDRLAECPKLKIFHLCAPQIKLKAPLCCVPARASVRRLLSQLDSLVLDCTSLDAPKPVLVELVKQGWLTNTL